MVDKLQRFGIGAYSYDFTQSFIEQVELPPGHGDLLPNNVRLVGLDGGYNLDGTGGARSAIGSTQGFFNVIGDGTEPDISQKTRAIYGMQAWGEKRLIKRYGDGITVWTWATVNNVRLVDRSDNLSYLVRTLQISFSTPKARWYGKSDMSFLDDGWTLDDGLTLTAPKVDRVSVGNGDTVTITNSGNAPAGAYIRWDVPTGQSLVNPTLTRRNYAGQIADQVTYADTLVAGDVVEIDSREHQTLINNVVVPSYSKLQSNYGPWLHLPPGTTTLEVSGTFTGGDALLTVDCWDTYF